MRAFSLAGLALSALAVTACTTPREAFEQGYVTDFESCAADGDNAVSAGPPRRCLYDGQYFVEGA